MYVIFLVYHNFWYGPALQSSKPEDEFPACLWIAKLKAPKDVHVSKPEKHHDRNAQTYSKCIPT